MGLKCSGVCKFLPKYVTPDNAVHLVEVLAQKFPGEGKPPQMVHFKVTQHRRHLSCKRFTIEQSYTFL